MKNLVMVIAIVLLSSCEKKGKTAPTPAPAPVAPKSKVWCIYSNFQGHKAYLWCASTEEEFNSKMEQYSQPGLSFYPTYDIKNTCSECQ